MNNVVCVEVDPPMLCERCEQLVSVLYVTEHWGEEGGILCESCFDAFCEQEPS